LYVSKRRDSVAARRFFTNTISDHGPPLEVVTDKAAALASMYRVLKPGGRFYCLEFSKVTSAPMARAYDSYSERALPFFGRLIARDAESYRYLHESIRRFPDQKTFVDLITRAGFSRAGYTNFTCGVAALHHGWAV